MVRFFLQNLSKICSTSYSKFFLYLLLFLLVFTSYFFINSILCLSLFCFQSFSKLSAIQFDRISNLNKISFTHIFLISLFFLRQIQASNIFCLYLPRSILAYLSTMRIMQLLVYVMPNSFFISLNIMLLLIPQSSSGSRVTNNTNVPSIQVSVIPVSK